MKKIALFLAVASLIGWSGVAFADLEGASACPVGQKLKKFGTIVAGSTAFGNSATASGGTISTQGADVRMIVVTCGGTACVANLADNDNIGAAAAGDYVIEPGAAANTSYTIDLTKTPLTFSNGISVGETAGNVASVAVYACQ